MLLKIIYICLMFAMQWDQWVAKQVIENISRTFPIDQHQKAMAHLHVQSFEMEDTTNNEVSSRNDILAAEVPSNDIRRELSSRLRPILRLMKFAGEYYGDTTLEEIPQRNSVFLSCIYCGIVLLGQWIIFAQTVISLFYEGVSDMKTTYFIMIFGIWYLQCAGVNTMCLFVLPITHKRATRFSKFIANLLATGCDFTGLTSKRINYLLGLTCFMAVSNYICLAFLDFYRNTSIARFGPWDGLLAYRILHLVVGIFNSFAFVAPVLLFGISCTLLSRKFETLHKKITTENPSSLNIGLLRQEHQKLCETVAVADKIFSPYLFVILSLHIPLICIHFNQLVKFKNPSEANATVIFTVLYWWLGLTAELTVIFIFGIRVNEKVSSKLYDSKWRIVSFFLCLENFR